MPGKKEELCSVKPAQLGLLVSALGSCCRGSWLALQPGYKGVPSEVPELLTQGGPGSLCLQARPAAGREKAPRLFLRPSEGCFLDDIVLQ